MNRMTPRSAREAALEILMKIVKQKAYSQIVLNDALENSPFEGKDRGLISQMVYGVVQQRLTLEYYLGHFVKKNQKLDEWVRQLLLLSFYQKIYLDKIPDHAIVNEAVNIAKRRGHKGISGFVNGVLRQLLRNGTPSLDQLSPLEKRWSIEFSHPLWLIEEWKKQYGAETTLSILKENQQAPSVTIRVNLLKATPDMVKEKLMTAGYQVKDSHLLNEALICEGGNPASTHLYKEGFITIQDESSMLAAHAVGPEADMMVLDACAGPGGKTAHMGELMKDRGSITALDLHKHKARLITNQAERLGLHIINAEALDARMAEEAYADGTFDRILVDAPCTGFGVIKRKPEIKYEKSPEDVNSISEVQQQILRRSVRLLKPGGILIYSTCTIERKENQQVALKIFDEFPDLQWDRDLENRLPAEVREKGIWEDAMVQILPHHFNTDGFFIAAFKKIEV